MRNIKSSTTTLQSIHSNQFDTRTLLKILPVSRSNDRDLCPKTDTAQTMYSTEDYQPPIKSSETAENAQSSARKKPTSYRKQQVHKLENLVTASSEQARKEYQEKLLSTRYTGAIIKHSKCLNKSHSLSKIMISCNISSTNLNEQVDMLNEFFQSVFCRK